MKQAIKNLRLLVDNAVKSEILAPPRALSIINCVDEIELVGADLLEACEELLRYISADNDTKVSMYPQSIDFAQKAIEKTKGE